MVYIDKKRKKQIILTSLCYLLLSIFSGVGFYVRGTATLPTVYVINISVDLFGMLCGFVLFLCCLIDVQKTGANHRYFLFLLNVTFLGLFTDAWAWIVDGIPSLRIINILDNTIYYLCAPIGAFFFFRYSAVFLKLDKERRKKTESVLLIGLYITGLSCVANLFGHFYFTVDRAGVYSRKPLQPLSLIFSAVTMIYTLILLLREKNRLEKYQVASLCAYVIAPLGAAALSVFIYGLSLSYGVIMLIVLLMYCVLNVSQGREKAIADRDLTVASSIQENMLPRIFPAYPDRTEFDLYATMNSAREVGGDFYDYFFVDDDHIALVIADVSGKGVPAALFMMIAKTLIKNRLQSGDSPGMALYTINNQFLENNLLDMFVTVWIGLLDVRTGEGVAVNAGHEHPILCRRDEGFKIIEYKHSPAVATFENIRFTEHDFKLEPGDTLFVYTDGVVEAENAGHELFGTGRVLDALNKDPKAAPKDLLFAVRADINRFVGKKEQFDDITMLCFKYLG